MNTVLDSLQDSPVLEQFGQKLSPDAPLFTRYTGNPILSRESWPYPISSVFNAGAVKLADGDTLLLCRVESRSGLSHLWRGTLRKRDQRMADRSGANVGGQSA